MLGFARLISQPSWSRVDATGCSARTTCCARRRLEVIRLCVFFLVVCYMVTPSLMLHLTTRRLPHISHAPLLSTFFISLCHQFCFSQCVGFWCWWSDHEFVLIETRSSWLWGTKTSSTSSVDKVGRRASENRDLKRRIHSPRPGSEKVHVEVRTGGSKAFSMV